MPPKKAKKQPENSGVGAEVPGISVASMLSGGASLLLAAAGVKRGRDEAAGEHGANESGVDLKEKDSNKRAAGNHDATNSLSGPFLDDEDECPDAQASGGKTNAHHNSKALSGKTPQQAAPVESKSSKPKGEGSSVRSKGNATGREKGRGKSSGGASTKTGSESGNSHASNGIALTSNTAQLRRNISKEDLGLWGTPDAEGYLLLEIVGAPPRVRLEDGVGGEYDHRKIAFWKSCEIHSKAQSQTLASLDALLSQTLAKKDVLDAKVRVRLCTIRMWLRRGLYPRQYARSHSNGVAEDVIEEMKAFSLDTIHHLPDSDSSSVDEHAQRAASCLHQMVQTLDRLNDDLNEGFLKGAGGGRGEEASKSADSEQEPNSFYTQVVGNQLIIYNITSICNCDGMEQMLLSPLHGSTVMTFGANHRIVVCADAASAKRGSKMITETVRAFRNTAVANNGTAKGPSSAAKTTPGGGKGDLLQLLSRDTSPGRSAPARKGSGKDKVKGKGKFED